MFVVGFIRSQQQTPYRRLHCRSLVCFVDRRDEEAAGKIAKSSLTIPPPFPEQKEKNSFHERHNGGGVRANLKTTIEVTIPVICVDLLCMQVMQAGMACAA